MVLLRRAGAKEAPVESRKPFNWPLLAVGLAFLALAIGFTVAFMLLG